VGEGQMLDLVPIDVPLRGEPCRCGLCQPRLKLGLHVGQPVGLIPAALVFLVVITHRCILPSGPPRRRAAHASAPPAGHAHPRAHQMPGHSLTLTAARETEVRFGGLMLTVLPRRRSTASTAACARRGPTQRPAGTPSNSTTPAV